MASRRAPSALNPRLAAAAVFLLGAVTVRSGKADGPPGHPWLGIAMGAHGDPGGVPVAHVVRGSPAARMGLLAGDLITAVGDLPVAASRDVVRAVATHHVGDSLVVTVRRGGASRQLRAPLVDAPPADAMLRMDHVGNPAPPWAGLDSPSSFPTLAALRGRVVVVDFWATWCGPCRDVVPVLNDWEARYGAQGLSIVGITTDPADAAAAFKERLDLRYPVASDPQATTSMGYGVSALPTLFVVDRRGVVRDIQVGADGTQEAALEVTLQKLLAEPPAALP